MNLVFIIPILVMWSTLPIYFLVVERRGIPDNRLGDMLGNLCGWVFFLSLITIWLSPQRRIDLGSLIGISWHTLRVMGYEFSLINIIIGLLFLLPGATLGLLGVRALGIKTSSYLKTRRLVIDGVYSVLRHPQYLGGILSHIGVSIILMAGCALLYTPLLIAQFYLMALVDEKALIRKFGSEYLEYRSKVPMFIPLRFHAIRSSPSPRVSKLEKKNPAVVKYANKTRKATLSGNNSL